MTEGWKLYRKTLHYYGKNGYSLCVFHLNVHEEGMSEQRCRFCQQRLRELEGFIVAVPHIFPSLEVLTIEVRSK